MSTVNAVARWCVLLCFGLTAADCAGGGSTPKGEAPLGAGGSTVRVAAVITATDAAGPVAAPAAVFTRPSIVTASPAVPAAATATVVMSLPFMSLFSTDDASASAANGTVRFFVHELIVDTTSCTFVVYSVSPAPGSGIDDWLRPGDGVHLETLAGRSLQPLKLETIESFDENVSAGAISFGPVRTDDDGVELVIPTWSGTDGGVFPDALRLHLLTNEYLKAGREPPPSGGSLWAPIVGVADHGDARVAYGGVGGVEDIPYEDPAEPPTEEADRDLLGSVDVVPHATSDGLPPIEVAPNAMIMPDILGFWTQSGSRSVVVYYAVEPTDCSLHILDTTGWP